MSADRLLFEVHLFEYTERALFSKILWHIKPVQYVYHWDKESSVLQLAIVGEIRLIPEGYYSLVTVQERRKSSLSSDETGFLYVMVPKVVAEFSIVSGVLAFSITSIPILENSAFGAIHGIKFISEEYIEVQEKSVRKLLADHQ